MATQRRGRAWQAVDITVSLLTGKTLVFNQISLNTTIRDLKLKIEDSCGIPSQCQRLTYLDMCDMFDHKSLEQSDVVDRGRLIMKVWGPFSNLVSASSAGFITQVFQSGIINSRGLINKEEAFIALYIASHCGHLRLALMLMSYGVDVNATTKLGRTALHAAGIKGQWSVLCLLINWGANIHSKDVKGMTAMDYARIFGHRESARGLALYQWHLNKEERAVRKHNPTEEEKSMDIMSQFPSHWLTEMPGTKVKQIFSPPVTMNLVAARAANMLVILPELTGTKRDDVDRAPSPNYECGKEHDIPGVLALNVKPKKKTSLPPIIRQRSMPPDYKQWLEQKTKQECDRIKKIKRELQEEEERRRLLAEDKQARAEKAFSTWISTRARLLGPKVFASNTNLRLGTA